MPSTWGAPWPPAIGSKVRRGAVWSPFWDWHDDYGCAVGFVLTDAGPDGLVLVRWATRAGATVYYARENLRSAEPS